MKIAVVHDLLVTYAGAESVLTQILDCFPEADLFAIIDFLPKNKRQLIHNKKVKTSFIQKIPFAKQNIIISIFYLSALFYIYGKIL